MKKIYSTIFTVPNLLTFYRLLLAPLLYLSLLEGMRDVCLLIFVLSGVSDLADGFFCAKTRSNQRSRQNDRPRSG